MGGSSQTERLTVLVLGDPTSPYWHPWGTDVIAQLRMSDNEVLLVNRSLPVEQQVAAADVVVDLGGEASATLARAAARRVRLWQFTSVGYDHFDVDSLHRNGITVSNCPGSSSADGLAELVFMLAMMVLRRFPDVDDWMRAGTPGDPTGHELRGRTILVVGFGASAREVASRARAFGMSVLAVRRSGEDPAIAREFALERLGGFDELDSLLPLADVVSLHVPLTEDTRGLLSRARLLNMRQGSIVINVSRGGLIDEQALLEALELGPLAGAGLDVVAHEPIDPGNPLLFHRRVVVTPHIAGQTHQTSLRRAKFAAANVDRVAAGSLPHSVIPPAPSGPGTDMFEQSERPLERT